jgi:hypothetical protein
LLVESFPDHVGIGTPALEDIQMTVLQDCIMVVEKASRGQSIDPVDALHA